MNNGNYPFEQGGIDRALDATAEGVKLDLRVAMPGKITRISAEPPCVSVQPQIDQLLTDGTHEPYPELHDVPLFTLSGGLYICTMPVAEGDPCLVIFADRCIDSWFATGAQDAPADFRMHDLSDAFALVGFPTRANVVPGYSLTSAELRSRAGDQTVRLDPDGTITNSNSAGSTVLTASGQFLINAPAGIVLNGNTHLIGNLSSEAGNGGVGQAVFSNIMRALDFATPNVPSFDRHLHPNPEGGNVGYPF
jgi:Phage protein Gp138 N-terminal domain